MTAKYQMSAALSIGCGAGWQPVVSPTVSRQLPAIIRLSGLPIRETADCQSALS
jgi:hypothetical protein